jgi:isoleucyl-tRNA synthetase
MARPQTAADWADSVHLADFPVSDASKIDAELEARMALAQQLTSQVLSLRKREKLRVRQPLRRIMVPALTSELQQRLAAVQELVLAEVNVKALEVLTDGDGGIVKVVKPDFKALGPRYGKRMKALAAAVNALTADEVAQLERDGRIEVEPSDGLGAAEVLLSDVEIQTQDIPGWTVSVEGGVTVALDVVLDDALRAEGLARELVNRVQNLRKDSGLEVTDRIALTVSVPADLQGVFQQNLEYIRAEVLAEEVDWNGGGAGTEVELIDGVTVGLALKKLV